MTTYRNRFFTPLPLAIALLAGACGNDPLADPNSVESRAKSAADSCQATLDKVGALFNQCNPTSSDAYTQMKSMLDAAQAKIDALMKQIMVGVAPACEVPDMTTVWRCSNTTANPLPVDTRMVQLTTDQVTQFGYPAKGCYVGVQRLTDPVGTNWFFGPVPATLVNSKAVPQIEFPYDYKTNATYVAATDWLCKRVP